MLHAAGAARQASAAPDQFATLHVPTTRVLRDVRRPGDGTVIASFDHRATWSVIRQSSLIDEVRSAVAARQLLGKFAVLLWGYR